MALGKEDPLQLWQHIHGGSSHFPIALIMVAFLFDVGATVFKKDSWRVIGFWCIILGALATIPAVLSGLSGGNGWFGVEWGNRQYSEHLTVHRTVALVAAGVSLVLAIWRAIRGDKMQGAEWIVYLICLGGGVGAIAIAGYQGGYVGHGY
jgi:uncharacterized membrane protein